MVNRVIISGWFESLDENELVFAYKVASLNNRVDFMHVPMTPETYADLKIRNLDCACVVSVTGELAVNPESNQLTLIPISFQVDWPADHQPAKLIA